MRSSVRRSALFCMVANLLNVCLIEDRWVLTSASAFNLLTVVWVEKVLESQPDRHLSLAEWGIFQ